MIVRIAIATLVLLISYAGFLVANTPASWVVAQARPQLAAAGAALGDVRGSAWTGSGELSLQGQHIGRLHWETSAWPLLGGHLDAHVKVRGDALRLNADLASGSGKMTLNNISGQADMALLARLSGLPTGLQGTLTAKLNKVVFNDRHAIEAADGQLVAHGVRIPDLGVGLGNLTLTLDDSGNSIQGALHNEGGDIALRGSLTLTPAGAYVLQATLKPRSGPKQNQIRDGLTVLLGAADAAGRFHYNTTGRFGQH